MRLCVVPVMPARRLLVAGKYNRRGIRPSGNRGRNGAFSFLRDPARLGAKTQRGKPVDAYEVLVAVALLIVAYGLVSGGRIGRYITGPMVFTAAGAGLAAIGLGGGEGAAATEIANRTMRLLAEFGLAILLFTDAARINPSHLKQEENLPARLLLAGLPGGGPDRLPCCMAAFSGRGMVVPRTDRAHPRADRRRPRPERHRQSANAGNGVADAQCRKRAQ